MASHSSPEGPHLTLDTTQEFITTQLPEAIVAYRAVVGSLNSTRIFQGGDEITRIADETLQVELTDWLGDVVLSEAIHVMDREPDVGLTLVAAPNVLATADEIRTAAIDFGYGQPELTASWSDFPGNSQAATDHTRFSAEQDISSYGNMPSIYTRYSAAQLSGTSPGNGIQVMFALIPRIYAVQEGREVRLDGSVLEPEHSKGVVTFTEQTIDGIHRRVPSVLQAVTYWQTLRARGDILSTRMAPFRTTINHVDLPPLGMPEYDKDYRYVPRTRIDHAGRAHLSRVHVGKFSVSGVQARRVAIM